MSHGLQLQSPVESPYCSFKLTLAPIGSPAAAGSDSSRGFAKPAAGPAVGPSVNTAVGLASPMVTAAGRQQEGGGGAAVAPPPPPPLAAAANFTLQWLVGAREAERVPKASLSRRREFSHFADALSPSLLEHLLQVERGCSRVQQDDRTLAERCRPAGSRSSGRRAWCG